MLERYSIVTLLKNVKDQINTGTGLTCYDTYPPQDAPSPFYFVEFARTTEIKSKTYYADQYTINIHAIGEPGGRNVDIYKLIDKVRAALSDDLAVNAPYMLTNQQSNGVVSLQKDPTNELHAVLTYSFDIVYGLKVKTI